MTSQVSLQQQIEQLIRPEIRALHAYPVGDASGMIKLDAMENPYRWPQTMLTEWQQLLADVALNRYPHPKAPDVVDGLRAAMQVSDQYDILLGNGSDEIIQILAMAVARPGATILAPEPGFVMYKMIATFVGLNYAGVPLADNFELDADAMLAAVSEHQPALVFLAQPNNPTGNLWDEAAMRSIIEACAANAQPGLVVMDEAYLPFSSRQHLYLLDEYSNVVVMRTLSKVGLAGLRLGLLIGRPEWLHELDKIRMPYNINVLTQASAAFALRHYPVLVQQCEQIKATRTVLQDSLSAMGFAVYESEANFVLARVPANRQARELFEQLKQQKILIKCLDGGHPSLMGCLRFTVGSEPENAALLSALQTLLA
ncbi:histidinol-phosphate transaminase [Parathalassolituus penaei]|uniref:Histidinol-phosphate aminotransferase n=1 Tax=Parathalassolituus penaei TaxID=2997323 RepID=A0A9X3EE75_9GAMM|nr:histidinol-phosphate transaminase [Parathalassolituus penaei]MCY0965565.1 histidinol-phosphate transaminase [Parathalassolituus penaei]